TTAETEPTYTLGPRDRGALLLGLRLPPLACLGLGLGAVLAGFLTGGGAVLVGCLVCVGCAPVAFFPVQGRPLIDWGRPIANHAYGRLTGQATYLGGPAAIHRPAS